MSDKILLLFVKSTFKYTWLVYVKEKKICITLLSIIQI